MAILGKIYLLLLSFFFFDFFHLQLQYDIHVFSRDTYPTQKQYYTCYYCVFRAITLDVEAPFFRTKLPLTCKEIFS